MFLQLVWLRVTILQARYLLPMWTGLHQPNILWNDIFPIIFFIIGDGKCFRSRFFLPKFVVFDALVSLMLR